MNFQLAPIGHSFKGSMAYYLHDKRQEGDEAHPETAERVAWTESRNLSVADPQLATGVMIATARQADELKAAAGVRNTGRKSTMGPVFAFSLSWRHDEVENLDRAEMLRAADHALKVLKLTDRQAVIVAHQDTGHPHVHVIVNRVCPQTGRMANIAAPDVKKLDKWADTYERENGKIVSPNRAAKYDEIEKKRQQHPDAEKRRQYVAEQERKRREQPSANKSRAAMLKEFGDQQKADHKKQWGDLAAKNKAGRDRIYAIYGERITEALERHKAETKPIWAQHFRQQRQAEKEFQAREQSISGVIQNAIMATATQKISGQLGNRGTLSATFGNVLSSQARAQAFAQVQDMNRRELASELKAIVDKEIAGLKDERARDLATQRELYAQQREALISRQNDERAKIRAAWQHIYDERAADRAGRKPYWKARQKAAPQQEQKPMKDRFDAARFQKPAAAMPTKPAFISQAQPAPSPSGDAPKPAPKRLQTVAERQPAMPAVKKVASAKRDWTPATAKPAPSAAKDWSASAKPAAPAPRKDWSASASREQARPIKPLPPRARDRDREPER